MKLYKTHTRFSMLLYIGLAHGDVHEVMVRDNTFSPTTINITAGDTVRWTNQGPGSHNVFSFEQFRCAESCEDVPGGDGSPSAAPWVAEIIFRVPEQVAYQCQPHVQFGMVGTVVVDTPNAVQVDLTPQNTFEPNQITVTAGQRIFFRNAGGVHNIKADDGSLLCADGCEGDGQFVDVEPTGFPWEFYHIMQQQPGTYTYRCDNPAHPDQVLNITIISDLIFSDNFESNG